MRAADILEHEHEAVLIVIKAARGEAEAIDKTGQVNAQRIGEFTDFFRNFVDRCHHGKEEKHLFPRLEERGLPRDDGPIGVMLQEHELGRAEVRAIAEALTQLEQGDGDAAEAIKEHLLAYADLLEAHIQKENGILFPMGDRVLTPDDQQSLVDAFDAVEREEMGEGTHERYHQWIHELVKE